MVYEFKPSRLGSYSYLCSQTVHSAKPVIVYHCHCALRDHDFCLASFGPEGNTNRGRWYRGLMGFYFNNRDDAAQFILAWG